MPSRVNVKFVIILAVSVVVLAGVVGAVGYRALTTSGAEYKQLGDELMAEGEYREAAKMYGRAVRQDQTRVDWLKKWREALLKVVPENNTERRDFYRKHYLGILKRLAVLQDTNAQAQRAVLDAIWREFKRRDPGPQTWQDLIDAADQAIERLPAENPETQNLRRYRGLAAVRKMQGLSLTEQERQQALEDLRAALEADPDDIEAAIGVIQWRQHQWRRALRERRPETAAERWKELEQELASLTERLPNHPRVRLAEVQTRIDRVFQETDNPVRRAERTESLRGVEDPLIRTLRQADPSELSPGLLDRAISALRVLRPEETNAIGLDLVEQAIQAHPENEPLDARLLLLKGELLRKEDRHEEAIATFQRVVDLDDRPVSLESMMLDNYRITALLWQADTSLEIYGSATTPAQREAALDRAKSLRDALSDRIPGGEDSRQVLLLDGKIALAEGRYDVAVSRLSEVDAMVGGEDAEVIRLLGRALRNAGTLGAAREQYERLLEQQPDNVQALLAAAELDRRLNNIDQAIERLEQVRELAPQSQQAAMMLQALRAQKGELPSVESRDPVTAALIRAEALRNQDPPAYDAAREVIEEAREQRPEHPRLLAAHIRLEMEAGRAERAAGLLEEAISAHPENRQFQQWKSRLQLADSDAPVDELLAMIESSQAPEASKLVQKHDVLRSAGQTERADAALDKAAELAPDRPDVVERLFTRAMRNDNLDRARRLATRAAELNIDQADGLLFQARIELAEENYDSARSTLQNAVERLPYNSIAWRLLGQAQLQLGRPNAAVESLEKAFNYNPGDLQTARIYIQTLDQLQRRDKALEAARRAVAHHPSDRTINEQWLRLEEAAGDPGVAVKERRRTYEQNPGNIENAAALARLLIDAEQWDEAERIIEDARSRAPERLDLAVLAARWRAAQGRIGAGEQVLRDFAETDAAEELNEQPYIALARYLFQHNQPDKAVRALDEAIEHQPAGVMTAQWMQADFLRQTGRRQEALAKYQEIIDAGADREDHLAVKRRAELLISFERYEKAEEALAPLTEPSDQDAEALMLRARAAAGNDDQRRAGALLDRAVEAAPNSPQPFINRARFYQNDPAQFSDVLADLDQAIRLQPDSIEARRLKASLLASKGRDSEAIAELRSAVESNPNSQQLRSLLIQQLVEMGRVSQARSEAQRAASDFPDEPRWREWIGDLYVREGEPDQAVEYFRQAYDISATPQYASKLARALLSTDPPQASAALDVIAEQKDADQRRTALTLLEARAHAVQGASQERVHEFVADAFDAADTHQALRTWFQEATRVFSSAGEFARFAEEQRPPEALENLYTVLLSRVQLNDPARRSQIQSRLERLAPKIEHERTLVDLHRVLGQLQYTSGDYAQAVETYQAGRELRPNDLEFNNNLAFLLAKHLNDPEQALPAAEKAAELAPTDANVLDTLGWVYYRLDRLSQARSALGRAIENASNIRESAPAYLHLAQTLAAQGEAASARRHAEQAKELIERSEQLQHEYGTDLESLMRELNQAE